MGNTLDRSIELPGGVPTETWTERPMTQAELDAETNAATQATIEAAAETAITRLRQIEQASNPTNAQVIAAIQDLAKFQRKTIVLILPVLLDDPEATAS